MSRTVLSGVSLGALALALAAVAAANDVKWDVSGFADGSIFDADQDVSGFANPGQDGFDALGNAKLQLRGSLVLEDGTEVGGRVELRLQSGGRSNSTTGVSDAFVAEKVYFWVENGLGRLELGAQDGAAKQAQAAPPSITKSMRIDNPLMMPVADGDGLYYRPAGLMLRTDSYASDQSAKVIYRSPRLFGLQLSISYMPEFSANLERFVKTSATDFDQQSNIWEAALNYDTNLDDIRIRASLTYLMGENEEARDTTVTLSSPWRSGDLSEWSGALNLKYKGFSVGAAYRHSNARGGFVDAAPVVLTNGASDTEIWSLGALYEWEDWRVGANYARGTANVAVESGLGGRVEEQTGEGWQIAAGYAVTTDIQISAGFQRYGFNASSGLNPFGLAEFHPAGLPSGGYVGDLDADIVFTEFSFGF
ncbi:hypothetical protein sos41_02150 [Alphaproteobacteria bacterium SO-S41]|nr:hypothetical protein sos41_02150 [Alphaproteobacteria bacterium SO-S41]